MSERDLVKSKKSKQFALSQRTWFDINVTSLTFRSFLFVCHGQNQEPSELNDISARLEFSGELL